ncbi:MAG: hypothetical protein ACREHD_26000 [Pirellulales bacterium]
MRWPTALLLATLWAAGCRSSQPTFDPFLPRTRIPPPPTGAATGAPDAYYTNPTPPMTGTAPAWSAPPAPAAGSLYAPPGGYQYQQSAPGTAPAASGYAPVPGPAPLNRTSAAAPTVGQRSKTKYIATADTTPSAVYERGGQIDVAQKPPVLAANEATSETVDIMDLPPVNRLSRAQ